MDVNDFEEQLKTFDLSSKNTRTRLTEMMSLIESGKIPQKADIDALDTSLNELYINYEKAVNLAKKRLSEKELPPEGSDLQDYAIAVKNSAMIIMQKMKDVENILSRFTRIRAKLSEYESALKPYQDKAAELLKDLSEQTVNNILPSTVAPKVVLDAISEGTEAYEVFEKVKNFYSEKVAVGVVAKQYYIEVFSTDVEDKSNAEAEPYIADGGEEKGSQIKSEGKTEEKIIEMQYASAERSIEDGKFLNPINKIKVANPSATAFIKECERMKKISPLIRIVLSLLTNVGVLTKDQAVSFAKILNVLKTGCSEESDKIKDSIEKSMETLVGKGWLAHYKYDVDGREEEAYCLSQYCYESLQKESTKKWIGFSIGKYKLIGGEKIEKSGLTDAIRKNAALIRYLSFQKDVLDDEKFCSVLGSFKFRNGHYYVDVPDYGEIYNCVMLCDETEISEVENKNILLCNEEEIVPETVNGNVNTIYLLCGNLLKKYDCSDGKVLLVPNESSTEEENEKTEDIYTEEAVVAKDIEHRKAAAVSSKEQDLSDNIVKTVIEESATPKNEDIPLNDIDAKTLAQTLLNRDNAPSDEEFCTLISKILKQSVSTDKELTSVIVQSILLANGAGLEKNRPQTSRFANQLKLATHLLLGKARYSADHLASVFENPEEDDKVLLLASYLFAMLTPSVTFDYRLKEQTKMFFADYEHYFGEYAAFKPLFNELMSLPVCFSPAVVANLGTAEERECAVKKLCAEAANYLTVPTSSKTHLNSLPPFYQNCFGRNSDLYTCMKYIHENKRDKDSVDFIEAVLQDFCDFQNTAFVLDNQKIEKRLDEVWNRSRVGRDPTKLLQGPRSQAISQFEYRLDLMIRWNELIGCQNNGKTDISQLHINKQRILNICANIQKSEEWKSQSSANVLSWLLFFMQDYLNGKYSELNVYSDLLLTGIIPVNNDGSPKIESDMSQIRYFEPWRNALRHILADKEKTVQEITDEILGFNVDKDEDGLKDNLNQLEMLGKLLQSSDETYKITEQRLQEAKKTADDRITHFKETLELAYTYNQINENEKETLFGIMTRYQSYFYDLKDFAGWRRFLAALEKQITEFAKCRKDVLRLRLDQEDDDDSELLLEARKNLENDKLAITEEYLNRYDAGERKLGSDSILYEKDYFEDFLKDDIIENFFKECDKKRDKALKNFGWDFLESLVPQDWTVRQKEDSQKMINCWPRKQGNNTPCDQIKALFSCLDLDVINVSKHPSRETIEVFDVNIRRVSKSLSDYKHPIAAFGTRITNPINVIVLYGNYTEQQLVDIVSRLNLGAISIVLIDSQFKKDRRRLLGEIFHKTTGQNPFLLIDKVLYLYLAMHQQTERLPALLKCTLPFTTYQPFVRDGGSTADEMFCGRTIELNTIIDPNGACVVYGGRQLGKTALLQRVESRCSKPENRRYAVYSSIIRIKDEKDVVAHLISDIEIKTERKIILPKCTTLKEMCDRLKEKFRSGTIVSLHLLIDEVDDFLGAISENSYAPLQPLVDLKREESGFKFVIAGLHNVCRAKNATSQNGIFGQLGTPLCIKPLSPTDALQLLSRPLSYLGFQIDRYPHLETILTNTNYYPGILQFFGYKLVETLTDQYAAYYSARDENPPFTLKEEQLGAVMNSADLNTSIKDKFRWSLELDSRYFMIARCIAILYYLYEGNSWLGFTIKQIMDIAEQYDIYCLNKETQDSYKNLLDEMVDMGILSQPKDDVYRLRRSSFVDIIGKDFDAVDQDIRNENEESRKC